MTNFSNKIWIITCPLLSLSRKEVRSRLLSLSVRSGGEGGGGGATSAGRSSAPGSLSVGSLSSLSVICATKEVCRLVWSWIMRVYC